MPALAQAPDPATTLAAPIDPARLAAARPVIDQVWPLGTYERIMRSATDQIFGASMASMYDMPVDEFMKGLGGENPADAKGQTFRELMAEQDPYWEERTRRGMKVMTEEIVGIMTEVEPTVRVALANAYARRFTVAQMNELHAFFATPTGRVYAAESMTLMMGPDMIQAMQAVTPAMMRRMPSIVAKIEAATKDLPPPKKAKP